MPLFILKGGRVPRLNELSVIQQPRLFDVASFSLQVMLGDVTRADFLTELEVASCEVGLERGHGQWLPELSRGAPGTHRLGLAQKQGWGRTEVPREQQTTKRAVMGACGERSQERTAPCSTVVSQDVYDEEGGCL